jgi:hypothetical protein
MKLVWEAKTRRSRDNFSKEEEMEKGRMVKR